VLAGFDDHATLARLSRAMRRTIVVRNLEND